MAHFRHKVLVGHLLRGCVGRGQQGAAKRRDVTGLTVVWRGIPVKERPALFSTGKHVQFGANTTFCGIAFLFDLLQGALQRQAAFPRHDQFSERFAPFHVLGAIPAHLALLRLLRPPDGAEAIVGIALRVLRLFGRGLVAPDLLFRVGETVPTVRDDARDVAVVVLDVGADLLGCGKGGAEEHERVPWTGNVAGVFVPWGAAGGGDGHGCEGCGGREGRGEGIQRDGWGRGGGRGRGGQWGECAHDDRVKDGPFVWWRDEWDIEGGIKGEHDAGDSVRPFSDVALYRILFQREHP